MTTLDQVQNFEVQHTSDLGVDRANSVIRGAKVIQAGDLNDMRPWRVDAETLERVAELGNQPNKGIKARYKHPSMFGDSLGTHLGRWTNFRVDGDSVRADLTVAKSASKSPDGNIADYILSLAEEDPESFGVSLAAILDESMFDSSEEIVPLRISKLHAVDTVGEPAATRGGLFERLSKEDGMSDEAKKKEVAAEKPVELANQEQPKVEFSIEKAGEMAKPYIENFAERGAQWFLEGRDLVSCFKEEVKNLNDVIECLKQENFAIREQLEAALANQGETEQLSQQVEPSEDEKKQAEFAEKLAKAKRYGLTENDLKWSMLFEKRS